MAWWQTWSRTSGAHLKRRTITGSASSPPPWGSSLVIGLTYLLPWTEVHQARLVQQAVADVERRLATSADCETATVCHARGRHLGSSCLARPSGRGPSTLAASATSPVSGSWSAD